MLPALREYYKYNIADFLDDFGMTVNPKNLERKLPAAVPFILYPKQREWVETVVDHWLNSKPLITEKTRQMGFSWLAMATACSLCIFYPGMAIGFGSRKQEYLDIIGDPKSLFQKGREFMSSLPVEFRAGWSIDRHAPHKRFIFPATKSSITGEAGDNIGRGATTALYFVDESAFIEHPDLVDSALSQTTNCRIDISTPNGMANTFAQKRFGGKFDVFTFRWTDDPTKDQAWYDKQCCELSAVIVAQEIDIDYSASTEGVVIPNAWVRAAIGAHKKLGIIPTGARFGALDVASGGPDTNSYCGAHGILVEMVEEWSGKGDWDTFHTAERAFAIAEREGHEWFRYDGDGIGALMEGDARKINEMRREAKKVTIRVEAFRGAGEIFDPEGLVPETKIKNKDYFANPKAQAWWALRRRFQLTHRAIESFAQGLPVVAAHDDLISLDENMPLLHKLTSELSQPTYKPNGVGKIVIDKTPDGAKSPNLGDGVMMRYAPLTRKAMRITDELLGVIGGRMSG